MCHRFHGIQPGRAKREKRIKMFQEEVKAKKMQEGDTPLSSMNKVKDVQRLQATPYVVLSGRIHAGQTSDPLSGFATMEKEQPEPQAPSNLSSEAPMLGDAKVEFMMERMGGGLNKKGRK